jgi:hypothetical protein
MTRPTHRRRRALREFLAVQEGLYERVLLDRPRPKR